MDDEDVDSDNEKRKKQLSYIQQQQAMIVLQYARLALLRFFL